MLPVSGQLTLMLAKQNWSPKRDSRPIFGVTSESDITFRNSTQVPTEKQSTNPVLDGSFYSTIVLARSLCVVCVSTRLICHRVLVGIFRSMTLCGAFLTSREGSDSTARYCPFQAFFKPQHTQPRAVKHWQDLQGSASCYLECAGLRLSLQVQFTQH